MGVAKDVSTAFAKAQAGAGASLPSEGTAFITVTDADKPAAVASASGCRRSASISSPRQARRRRCATLASP